MVDTYRGNLLKLRGLRFDSGYEDEFLHIPPTARALSTELTARGIDHTFEEYNGDHRNRLWAAQADWPPKCFHISGSYWNQKSDGRVAGGRMTLNFPINGARLC